MVDTKIKAEKFSESSKSPCGVLALATADDTGQSWEHIARLFRRLHVVELRTNAGVVFRRSELSREHRAILKTLGIRSPREIQKVDLKS